MCIFFVLFSNNELKLIVVYISLDKVYHMLRQSKYHALSVKGWEVALKRRIYSRYDIASAATLERIFYDNTPSL